MVTQSLPTRRVPRTPELPGYIHHSDFDAPGAGRSFSSSGCTDCSAEEASKHMPDETTRDRARRMHYAASRMHAARTRQDRARWQAAYFEMRDAIVLGNRKLIYRAVRRRMAVHNRADDMIGECHIVLIQAVAAFNPWLDIRFSTYAYTCIVRALARSSRRHSTDWLTRALSLDALADGEPSGRDAEEPPTSTGSLRLEDYLQDDHPLLSDREKAIIVRRFSLSEDVPAQTLEQVGKAVGLSKERVRQVQASALGKLRAALRSGPVK